MSNADAKSYTWKIAGKRQPDLIWAMDLDHALAAAEEMAMNRAEGEPGDRISVVVRRGYSGNVQIGEVVL